MKNILILTLFIGFLFTDKTILSPDIKYTRKYNIWYLEKLIYHESSNNPRAKSPAGARGLMQIMPAVLEDHNTFCNCGYNYSQKQLYVSRHNLHVGIWQLNRLKKTYTNDIDVVSSYNMGSGNTQNGIYNLSYCFNILGTNAVQHFLKGKKTKSFEGSTRRFHVYN